jgi:CubicO group peptidase (beta-lactamase class C family)
MPDLERRHWPAFGVQFPSRLRDLLLQTILANRLDELIFIKEGRGRVRPRVPGCVFMVRRDGEPLVSLGVGYARLPTAAQPNDGDPLPMSENSVVHIASMSKSITAAAVLALFDDWAVMFDQLHALPPAPDHLPTHAELAQLPAVLLPIFGNTWLARRITAENLQSRFPQGWRALIEQAAMASPASGPQFSYPLQQGLLLNVLRGAPAPANAWRPADAMTIYVDLMDRRLQQEAARLGMVLDYAAELHLLPISQFLRHDSGLREETLDDGPESEPVDGGLAIYDLWRRLISVLKDGGAFGGDAYKNSNYTALGALIEAMTELKYVDWVRYRVLNDTRFSLLGRRGEPDMLAAKYYGADFAGSAGVFHSDYTNWSGNGGWYATAAQITDWMHVLYTGAPYGHAGAPIVSANARSWLFGGEAFGPQRPVTDASGRTYTCYEHNGGATVGGGATNGCMGIIAPNDAGKPVYTAFLLANGAIDGTSLYVQMVDTLMRYVG